MRSYEDWQKGHRGGVGGRAFSAGLQALAGLETGFHTSIMRFRGLFSAKGIAAEMVLFSGEAGLPEGGKGAEPAIAVMAGPGVRPGRCSPG